MTDTHDPQVGQFRKLLAELLQRVADADCNEHRLALLQAYLDFCGREAEAIVSVTAMEAPIAFIDDEEPQAMAWTMVGCLLEKRQAWGDASEAYRNGLALQPKDQKIRYFLNNNLGFCLNQLGHHGAAEEFCMSALRIDPQRSNAYKNYGLSLAGQERFAEAVRALVSGIEICPQDDRSLRILEDLAEQHPDLKRSVPSLAADIATCRRLVRDAAV